MKLSDLDKMYESSQQETQQMLASANVPAQDTQTNDAGQFQPPVLHTGNR